MPRRSRIAWTFALALALAGLGAAAAPGRAVAADEAERAKWGEHWGDLPFVVGYEKGMKEVEFTGRPPMYFFTTTW
jgi:ABC-type sugar transport system substrate-binding protein